VAITLAVSGKGGSGKTTLAAIVVRELAALHTGPVLAVDADPNACLGLTLGVQVTGTVAELREKARSKEPSAAGMDRVSTFEYGLQGVITEAKGFDLVTMGRPEGPDCYCAANNLLRRFLDRLSSQYAYVVLDNEAGMEHLSRRTTNHVDVLYVVAQPSPVGRVTARRILDLARSLPISVKRAGVVWNQSDTLEALEGYETLGRVPHDPAVLDASLQGKTLFDVAAHSPALCAIREMLPRQVKLTR
jgi:CO dehydrogenase maturation factor